MEENQSRLLQFISDHGLKRPEGTVLFEALVSWYEAGSLKHLQSQVLIITLPKVMVLYVLEFIKEDHHQAEMYSTGSFFFNYTPGNASLEIKEDPSRPMSLVSISPLS